MNNIISIPLKACFLIFALVIPATICALDDPSLINKNLELTSQIYKQTMELQRLNLPQIATDGSLVGGQKNMRAIIGKVLEKVKSNGPNMITVGYHLTINETEVPGVSIQKTYRLLIENTWVFIWVDVTNVSNWENLICDVRSFKWEGNKVNIAGTIINEVWRCAQENVTILSATHNFISDEGGYVEIKNYFPKPMRE